MYPYQGRNQSQGPPPQPPPQGSSAYGGRGHSSSRSPEQSRASLSRPVPHSPGSMSNHSHHDDPWYRGGGGSAGEMREVNYPPASISQQSRYGGGSARDRADEYGGGRSGPPNSHWMEDRGYGPPPRQQPHHHHQHQQQHQGPPPSSRQMDDRGRNSNYSQHLPHFSHPPSPSQRPRTPPPSGSRSSSSHRPPSWDPVSAGPMSAPPSMVPRIPPNQINTHGMRHPSSSSQQTSPLLPGVSHNSASARSSSEGLGNPNNSQVGGEPGSGNTGGHHRIPSWGSYPATAKDGMNSPPRNPNRLGGGGGGPGVGSYRGGHPDQYGPRGGNEMSGNLPPHSMDSRKRPASESPPTSFSGPPFPPQQTSPSQRADVMSMSSILGPSGGRASSVVSDVNPATNSTEKRRRLEGGQGGMGLNSPSNTENVGTSQGRSSNGNSNNNGSVPSGPTSSNSASANNSTAISEAAAVNLARRKWSGPIAEEAAQQAAAWRAQEQRWGTGSNSRSPKVGMLPLGGSGERQNSPFGSGPRAGFPGTTGAAGRGVSPIGQEGHRRQRSDGLQAPNVSGPQPMDTRSPLARSTQLSAPSPPSSMNQPAGIRAPTKQQKQQQSQQQQQRKQEQQSQPPPGAFAGPPPPGYYRGATPPPPPSHPGASVGMPPGGAMPPQHLGSGQHGPPPPQQMYSQPSYHAYDSQGRPVEIDVDEVRGGAFAGHGNPPPAHMTESGYRHGMGPYDEPMPGPPMQPQPPHIPSGGHMGHPMGNVPQRREPSSSQSSKKAQQQQQQLQQDQIAKAQSVSTRSVNPQQQQQQQQPSQSIKQIHRSVSPIMPGPAPGLLPTRIERQRSSQNQSSGRPSVASKDFNSGPKVDSDAVRIALKEAMESPRGMFSGGEIVQTRSEVNHDQDDLVDVEYSVPYGKHLGSFLYDARKSPLLPGDLLRRNIGATLEVRIPARCLGVGPQNEKDHDGISHGRWGLNSDLNENDNSKPRATTNGSSKQYDEISIAESDADAHAFWNNGVLLKRKAWGTDVYTDDSDVLMMCLHSGFILGPFLEDVPSWVPPGKAVNAWKKMTDELERQGLDGEMEGKEVISNANFTAIASPESIKKHNENLDKTMDLSVILRVAPKLIAYKGSQRGGVKTRSWGNTHDGVSLAIESVSLRPVGYASGQRGLKSMKQRIDQLARLKMLANIAGDAIAMDENCIASATKENSSTPIDDEHLSSSKMDIDLEPNNVRKNLLAGGLLDILTAAKLISTNDPPSTTNGIESNSDQSIKRFWQFDPLIDVKAA